MEHITDEQTSTTVDDLDSAFTYTSSNSNLFNINNTTGKTSVNRTYQTHQTQTVTVTATIPGTSNSKSKEITINPVVYDQLPATPVATYVATSSMYMYTGYNTRYQTEHTLYSSATKNALDMVYYAFINIDANGNCSLSSTTYLDETLALKQEGIRVLASVNGCGSGTTHFYNLTLTDQGTSTLVTNIMNLIDQYGFDGVDIDWEYESSSTPVNVAGTTRLFNALRTEMTNRQAANGSPYLLTAAIPASSWAIADTRYDFALLNQKLDYINIMSYDLNKEDKASHLAPLYSSSNDSGWGFSIDDAVTRFVNKGFSKSKLIAGCAGYGKTYTVSSNLTGTYPALGVSGTLGKIEGITDSFASGTIFTRGINQLMNTNGYVKYTEYNNNNKYVGTYLYNATLGIFISYDDSASVIQKYNYAVDNGMGIMNWSYGEDCNEFFMSGIISAMNG